MRYFIRISFRGTRYHGWQSQENALTVQQVLTHALKILHPTAENITGCGRTDTGVHASMFFVHFDLPSADPDSVRTAYRLNAILPSDIAVLEVFGVHPDAHARFSAVQRTYRYYITRLKDPFAEETSLLHRKPLLCNKMNHACAILRQHNDFKCFTKKGSENIHYLCNVFDAFWEENHGGYVFTITANRFLRNMVRAIVGTMILVGEQKISIDGFQQILASGTRSLAGESAPAHGLFLEEVLYPEDIRL